MNLKRPNLNAHDVKNAELFIAADTLMNYFKKANIMSKLTYEQKFLSYQAMNVQSRNKKTDELIDLIEETMKERTEEWGRYWCNIHFLNKEKDQGVLADAGIFTVTVSVIDTGKYRLDYKEIQ